MSAEGKLRKASMHEEGERPHPRGRTGDHGDDDLQRRTLIRRAVAAGALIVVLIGGLALLEQGDAPVPMYGTAKVEPEPQVSVPATASGDAQAPEAAAQTASADPLPPLPADPAQVERAAVVDVPPPLPEDTAPPEPARSVAHAGREPRLLIAPGDTMIRRSAAGATSVREAVGRAFVLQVGVFASPANAEQLRAKLAESGVPARLETRVQAGPFKTRGEAEQARTRLASLGMEAGAPISVKAKFE